MAQFTIGQIAEEFGVTLRTLRFYEQRGLLRPTRSARGPRLYSEIDRDRLREILLMRKLGFTVAEITQGGFDRAKFEEQLEFARQQRDELDQAITMLEERVAGERIAMNLPNSVG